MSARIVAGGRSYEGKSVVIRGNKVIVDGKDVTPDTKQISISIIGDLQILEAEHCERVEVRGNVGRVAIGGGDLSVDGAVTGNISAGGGDVSTGDVGGSISAAGGDVTCGNVGGDVRCSGGDISYRK